MAQSVSSARYLYKNLVRFLVSSLVKAAILSLFFPLVTFYSGNFSQNKLTTDMSSLIRNPAILCHCIAENSVSFFLLLMNDFAEGRMKNDVVGSN